MTSDEHDVIRHSEKETRQKHNASYHRKRKTLTTKWIRRAVKSTYQNNVAIRRGTAEQKDDARSQRDKTALTVRAAR